MSNFEHRVSLPPSMGTDSHTRDAKVYNWLYSDERNLQVEQAEIVNGVVYLVLENGAPSALQLAVFYTEFDRAFNK